MKVLANVHMGPPSHNAGSELMIHTMLRYMVEQGHDARAVVGRGVDRVHEGVAYRSTDGMRHRDSSTVLAEMHAWADVVVTHLDNSRLAMRYGKSAGIPIVHLVHNHLQMEANMVTGGNCDLAVFNSEWLREAVEWGHDSIVVRPPVWSKDYKVTGPHDSVCMANMTYTKGCETFYELARRRRSDKFLGVLGAYGEQIIRQIPNVEILQHTGDMAADFYARCRVLLVPSDYESWGRVAIEALASGIPVIAHPTDGLLESLGTAGIFCDRGDVDEWEAELKRLDDPAEYKAASARSLARSLELDQVTKADLVGWERALIELVS